MWKFKKLHFIKPLTLPSSIPLCESSFPWDKNSIPWKSVILSSWKFFQCSLKCKIINRRDNWPWLLCTLHTFLISSNSHVNIVIHENNLSRGFNWNIMNFLFYCSQIIYNVKLIYSIGNQSAFDFTLNGDSGIVELETLSNVFHLKSAARWSTEETWLRCSMIAIIEFAGRMLGND